MIASRATQDKVVAKRNAALRVAPSLRVVSSTNPPMRKPGACACGGGCPRCQMKSARPRETASAPRVSSPGDAYEVEADRVADKVMRMAAPASIGAAPIATLRTGSVNPGPLPDAQAAMSAAGRGGAPLPRDVRAFFEPRFGHDFSGVRVHADGEAANAARAVHARAYTFGRDIVFDSGEYAPATAAGKRLLAHELAHVVQQRKGMNRSLQRKSWNDDESGCVTTQKLLVQLIFDDDGSDVWDKARKDTFRNDFKSTIENSFNGNAFHVKPAKSSVSHWVGADTACPCSATGFKPEVEINLVADGKISVSEDWEVDVKANSTSGKYMQSDSNTSYGDLNEQANQEFDKQGAAAGVKQRPTAHEFGHFLGLDHPGAGLNEGWTVGGVELSKRELSPGATEYSHVGKDKKGRDVDGTVDLMGSGNKLRAFYFDSWKDHLSSKYGSGCDWNIV